VRFRRGNIRIPSVVFEIVGLCVTDRLLLYQSASQKDPVVVDRTDHRCVIAPKTGVLSEA
jgi:hypothetical protein